MIYSYIITRDYGFAPNPFYGICTLATCKPGIRKRANIGDWVIGFGSVRTTYKNKLIYAMKVEKIIGFDEYWNSDLYKCKRPVPNGSLKQNYGDNIYHTVAGKWIQENSHHSLENGAVNELNLIRDVSGKNVLISNCFWYFGSKAVDVPTNLSCLIPKCRNYATIKDQNKINDLFSWLNSLEETGFIGEPIKFKRSFERYNGK